jgi:predicted enzyme related to lactoylglutathione lyase
MAHVIHFEVPVDDAERGGAALTSKMPIPGVGYMASCRDTEGNAFDVCEDDRTAQP